MMLCFSWAVLCMTLGLFIYMSCLLCFNAHWDSNVSLSCGSESKYSVTTMFKEALDPSQVLSTWFFFSSKAPSAPELLRWSWWFQDLQSLMCSRIHSCSSGTDYQGLFALTTWWTVWFRWKERGQQQQQEKRLVKKSHRWRQLKKSLLVWQYFSEAAESCAPGPHSEVTVLTDYCWHSVSPLWCYRGRKICFQLMQFLTLLVVRQY